MNIYEKLQTLRIELQKNGMSKSGSNTHSKFSYFELSDFLPKANELMNEHKMCGVVRFLPDVATLTLYNSEKPEESIEFVSPMSTAKLPACHEVQNLGAVQTYLRRYLYMAAFEIAECDAVDAETEKPQVWNQRAENPPQWKAQGSNPDDATKKERIAQMLNVARLKGHAADKVRNHSLKKYGCELADLSLDQVNELFDGYEKLEPKAG